ncbi:MAG: hypothetical protein H7Z12_15250 [Rhodospirillaceae bacterium]|nr:hypothetical protein [Rhodospirillales bacterium]
MTAISSADLYCVRAGYEWALIAMDENTGLVAVQSSFGAFNYVWPPQHRSQPLDEFVTTLDFGYFMSKTRGLDAKEFDLDETIKAFRRWIIDARRATNIDKDEAREAWDALEDIRMEDPRTAEHMGTLINDDRARLHAALGDDWWDGLRTSYKPECTGFWDIIWPAFTIQVWCRHGLESPMIGL